MRLLLDQPAWRISPHLSAVALRQAQWKVLAPNRCVHQALVFFAFLLAALGGCAATPSTESLQAFTTDGCSRFPDRAPNGKSDWCHCCVVHDLAYWRGGTSEERLAADLALKACVLKATGSEVLAEVMFAGVRIGGGPHLPTSYRWGYGWPAGTPYRQLTPEEDSLASSLAQEYLIKDRLLMCPADSKINN